MQMEKEKLLSGKSSQVSEENVEKNYDFSILVVLKKSRTEKDIFNELKANSNYLIYTNGSTNLMHDSYGSKFLPDCIVEDNGFVRKDILEVYQAQNVKRIIKYDSETTHLDKTLYFCLEQISEKCNFSCKSCDEAYYEYERKAIVIYIDMEDRIDKIISTYNDIFKCMTQYKKELSKVDILLYTSSSLCVFLKEGQNIITPNRACENMNNGYSIFCLSGESDVKVWEKYEKEQDYTLVSTKNIKFGSTFLFRKKIQAINIKIETSFYQPTCLIYSSTLKTHT